MEDGAGGGVVLDVYKRQAQTSQSGKPNTSKMMQYIFPLMSVFFCWSYNAGFALYWVTSNLYACLLYTSRCV